MEIKQVWYKKLDKKMIQQQYCKINLQPSNSIRNKASRRKENSSWNTIVDKVPTNNPTTKNILFTSPSSISSLTIDCPCIRKHKKTNKVDNFLNNMKTRTPFNQDTNTESESESVGDEDVIPLHENNVKDSSGVDSSLPDQETKSRSNTTTPTKRIKVDNKSNGDRTNKHKVNNRSRGKIINNNKSLHNFGFKFETKKKVIKNNKSIKYSQDYLPKNKLTILNEPKGDPMIKKPSSSIRIFYINISGIDQSTDEHLLL